MKQKTNKKEKSLREIYNKYILGDSESFEDVLDKVNVVLSHIENPKIKSIKSLDVLVCIAKMRTDYLRNTESLKYKTEIENESLSYRRIDQLEKLYSNLHQISYFRENC
ncbi:hypothetical protein KAT36_03555 [Candidatus Pacearchaeota archaeon]|nr:hypothetical protein [Candidatus Pacearchaeota archaeon]